MALFDVPKKLSSPFADFRGDHGGVRVPNLQGAIDWYTNTLDFRLTATTEAVGLDWVFLSPPNDDSVSIELAAGPGSEERPGGDDLEGSLKIQGWHHFCWRVDNIEATLAELERRSVKIVAGPLEYEPIKRRGALFADPWGNLFEIIQDAPSAGENVVQARDSHADRREMIRQFFRYADAGDVRALDFYTDDVELTYPKFGKVIGKDAVRTFITHMSGVFGKLEHDIDGLTFIEDGDRIAVEGREWGEMADGTPFPDGRISQGLFCNVYEFEGDLIRVVRIYVDPDFTSSDTAMLKTLRPAG